MATSKAGVTSLVNRVERALGAVKVQSLASASLRCNQCCFKCTTYQDVERTTAETGTEKRFSIVVNMACCGRVDNCCGATCCKDSMVRSGRSHACAGSTCIDDVC